MTAASVTLDTNILVYSVQAGEPRQPATLAMVQRARDQGCILTLQALGEFFAATSGKRILSRVDAAAQVRRWLELFPSPAIPSASALLTALIASEAGRFGYWDALLLATAGEAGCTTVISEDMAPGAALGPVKVVSAFQDGAVSPEALALLG